LPRSESKAQMKTLILLIAVVAASAQTLPLPNSPVAKDIPGAKELPDPGTTYKVVFDIAKAADKVGDVNPTLTAIARFVNTLAKNGVQADHRKIAVVMHQGGTPIVLNNEAFRARFDGHDNPNIPIIRELTKAGVDFRVCGQAVLANKIDPKTIQPEIELDLWALTTIVNLEMRGYVRVGAN
jgi:intracellular sulfur oxidation DsrE/DsrF family protein